MKKSDKGLVSEALAQAHFAKDPDLIVFTALGGVGPIDLVVFNTKTKQYTNYDVKTVSYRKSATKYAHKKNDRINRSPSKIQCTMNVKIVYVYEDGKILIK
jgi:hypothetical protein